MSGGGIKMGFSLVGMSMDKSLFGRNRDGIQDVTLLSGSRSFEPTNIEQPRILQIDLCRFYKEPVSWKMASWRLQD